MVASADPAAEAVSSPPQAGIRQACPGDSSWPAAVDPLQTVDQTD